MMYRLSGKDLLNLENKNGKKVRAALPHAWCCRYQVPVTAPETILADYVAICAGLHVTPAIPKVQGLEHIFNSTNRGDSEHLPAAFHSVEYKERSQLTGRRVMILGSGETGMDLAYEAVKAGAKQVVLCSRSG